MHPVNFCSGKDVPRKRILNQLLSPVRLRGNGFSMTKYSSSPWLIAFYKHDLKSFKESFSIIKEILNILISEACLRDFFPWNRLFFPPPCYTI